MRRRRLRDLLFRAVEKRLVADVPLGAFLSGGLDSSLIVAIMSRLMQKPVKTLSVGFEGPQSHDERPFARQMARHCRTDHHEITLKPDVVSSRARFGAVCGRAVRHLVGDSDVLDGPSRPRASDGRAHRRRRRRDVRRLFALPLGALGRRCIGVCPSRRFVFIGSRRDAQPAGRRPFGGALRSRVTRFVGNARRSPASRRLGWGSAFSEEEKLGLYSGDLACRSVGTTTALLERRAGDGEPSRAGRGPELARRFRLAAG